MQPIFERSSKVREHLRRSQRYCKAMTIDDTDNDDTATLFINLPSPRKTSIYIYNIYYIYRYLCKQPTTSENINPPAVITVNVITATDPDAPSCHKNMIYLYTERYCARRH